MRKPPVYRLLLPDCSQSPVGPPEFRDHFFLDLSFRLVSGNAWIAALMDRPGSPTIAYRASVRRAGRNRVKTD